MANDIILSVRDLKKYFSTKNGELHAVDGVSFDSPRGTTLGVVGESGCGKSTLGRVILHLLQRTSGTICFDGEDISDVSPKRLHELRREMQIIFQDPFSSIDPRKTVSEIIGEPLLVHKLVDNSAGCVYSGPDPESDAGSSGGTAADIHVHHPQSLSGQAYF